MNQPGEPQDRFVGKSVPTPEFAGDDGSCSVQVRELLGAVRLGTASQYEIPRALREERAFVVVTAVLDSAETVTDGSGNEHTVEKDSHMASISVTVEGGRRALVAFTGIDAVTEWTSALAGREDLMDAEGNTFLARDLRPMPVPARNAAAAALAEGSDFLLLDPGSAWAIALPIPGTVALAEGRDWRDPITDDEVLTELHSKLAPIAAQAGGSLEVSPGSPRQHDLVVTFLLPESYEAQAVPELLQSAAESLGSSSLLRLRLAQGVALSARQQAQQ